jgi:hypothetical protein
MWNRSHSFESSYWVLPRLRNYLQITALSWVILQWVVLPTFRNNLSVPSSKVKNPRIISRCVIAQEITVLIYLPTEASSHKFLDVKTPAAYCHFKQSYFDSVRSISKKNLDWVIRLCFVGRLTCKDSFDFLPK